MYWHKNAIRSLGTKKTIIGRCELDPCWRSTEPANDIEWHTSDDWCKGLTWHRDVTWYKEFDWPIDVAQFPRKSFRGQCDTDPCWRSMSTTSNSDIEKRTTMTYSSGNKKKKKSCGSKCDTNHCWRSATPVSDKVVNSLRQTTKG